MQFFLNRGYLVKPILKSSQKKLQFDTSKLRTVMGEYDQSQIADEAKDNQKIQSQVEDALPRLEGRKKVIWFCCNIEHAIRVYEELKAQGELASLIHSKQSQDEQEIQASQFEDGFFRHLVFVTIVSTGWDYPPTDALVILRPTRSATLYVQVCGRILRTSPDKKDALILDYAQVIQNLGPIDNPVLEFAYKRKENDLPAPTPLKVCEKCLEFSPVACLYCEACGQLFPKTTPEEKLERKPDVISSPISTTPSIFEAICIKAVAVNHVSKSGNACVKIEYHIENKTMLNWYLPDRLDEYFSIKHAFAFAKLKETFQKLGIEESTFSDRSEAKYLPTLIRYKKDGKYWKISDKIFV